MSIIKFLLKIHLFGQKQIKLNPIIYFGNTNTQQSSTFPHPKHRKIKTKIVYLKNINFTHKKPNNNVKK